MTKEVTLQLSSPTREWTLSDASHDLTYLNEVCNCSLSKNSRARCSASVSCDTIDHVLGDLF